MLTEPQPPKTHYFPASLSLSSSSCEDDDSDYKDTKSKQLKEAQEVLEFMIEQKCIQSEGDEDSNQSDSVVSEAPDSIEDDLDDLQLLESINLDQISKGIRQAQKQKSQLEMYYKGSKIKVPASIKQLTSKDFSQLLQKGWKSLESDDRKTILNKVNIDKDTAIDVFKGQKFNFSNQVELFQNLVKQDFFTKLRQSINEKKRKLAIYDRRDLLKRQLRETQQMIYDYDRKDYDLIDMAIFSQDDSQKSTQDDKQCSQDIYEKCLKDFDEYAQSQDSEKTVSYISEYETENPKSDYNKIRKREVKELAKGFARVAIKKYNKKQLQAFTFSSETKYPGRNRPNLCDLVDEDFDLSWIHSSERFQNFNRTKQILTINERTPEEIMEYRKQEAERYKHPLDPWLYTFSDGKSAIVGPALKKKAQVQCKPREHFFLRNDRPVYVNILSVVRDAAAKLPDFVGTRTDVAELAKDSQYLADNLSDFQISQTVSGGLDRLSAEEDPSVRFDPVSKLWIYLHGKRTLDNPKWQIGMDLNIQHMFDKNQLKTQKNQDAKSNSGAATNDTSTSLYKSDDMNTNNTISDGDENYKCNSERMADKHASKSKDHKKDKHKSERAKPRQINPTKTATSDKLQSLLKSKAIKFVDATVQISQDTKQCDSGVGTITFETRQDLANGAKSIVGEQLEGKPIELKILQNGDYNIKTSIFVSGLPEQVTESDLLQEFQRFGFILSCMVVVNQITKVPKGIAFIDFENEQAAQNAIQSMHGKQLSKYPGTTVSVTPYQLMNKGGKTGQTGGNEEDRHPVHKSAAQTNLFVNRVPVNITDQQLRELFQKYGPVRSIKIKRPNVQSTAVQQTGLTQLYGIAYVDFVNQEDAEKAMNALNGTSLGMHQLQIEFYKKGQNTPSNNSGDIIDNMNFRIIFIKGLNKYVTEEQLHKVCSKYGNVVSCHLKKKTIDGQTFSRGMAQVAYSNKEEGTLALQKLPFEVELGDLIEVDLFMTQQGRIQEHEEKNPNPLNQFVQQRYQPGGFMMGAPMNKMGWQQNQGQFQMQHQQRPMNRYPSQQMQQQRPSMPQQQQYQQRYRPRNQRPHHQQQQNPNYRPYQKNQQTPMMQPPYNMPMPQPMPQPAPGQQNPIGYQQMFQAMTLMPSLPAPLLIVDMNEFNSIQNDQEKKNYLGNLLYPVVEERHSEYAPKITGMLIDQPTTQILQYCANRDLFNETVDQAAELLKKQDSQ